eukprot:212027-Pelagomonas_calceolata.AAC.1
MTAPRLYSGEKLLVARATASNPPDPDYFFLSLGGGDTWCLGPKYPLFLIDVGSAFTACPPFHAAALFIDPDNGRCAHPKQSVLLYMRYVSSFLCYESGEFPELTLAPSHRQQQRAKQHEEQDAGQGVQDQRSLPHADRPV